MVTNFIDVSREFGFRRMIPMLYALEHLASHKGMDMQPGIWREEGTQYQLADWGLTGNINEPEATVTIFVPIKNSIERGKIIGSFPRRIKWRFAVLNG